ncbi:MAG: hypothetical protein WBM86_20565, partial [Waterburya sp.]
DFDHLTDKIHIGSGFGVTDTNLFNYNSGTGALSFNGSQFATLTNSGFSIADDLILVYIMVRDVLSTR